MYYLDFFESERMSKIMVDEFADLCAKFHVGDNSIIHKEGKGYFIIITGLDTYEEIELINKINLHVYHDEKQVFK